MLLRILIWPDLRSDFSCSRSWSWLVVSLTTWLCFVVSTSFRLSSSTSSCTSSDVVQTGIVVVVVVVVGVAAVVVLVACLPVLVGFLGLSVDSGCFVWEMHFELFRFGMC